MEHTSISRRSSQLFSKAVMPAVIRPIGCEVAVSRSPRGPGRLLAALCWISAAIFLAAGCAQEERAEAPGEELQVVGEETLEMQPLLRTNEVASATEMGSYTSDTTVSTDVAPEQAADKPPRPVVRKELSGAAREAEFERLVGEAKAAEQQGDLMSAIGFYRKAEEYTDKSLAEEIESLWERVGEARAEEVKGAAVTEVVATVTAGPDGGVTEVKVEEPTASDVVVQATVLEPEEPEAGDLRAPEERAESNEASEAAETEIGADSGDRTEAEDGPGVSEAGRPVGDAAIAETRQDKGPEAGEGPAAISVDVGGGVKMDFVRIPAGQFFMGSPPDEPGREVDEGVMHRVWINKPFYIGKFEVTQGQYEAVMGQKPSHFDGGDLPVESVSWYDAVGFCEGLGRKDGRRYRLPTEAEWEYACRAGSSLTFSFGSSDEQLSEYGWHVDSSQEKSHVVGLKKPNAFGLCDMHGNVWEWCRDWYGKDYYGRGPAVDPQGPATGEHRVLRGGSWQGGAVLCRSALRGWGPPTSIGGHVGFRVVLEAPD